VYSYYTDQATLPWPYSAYLAVALHHDVVDVCLQRHADVLALARLKLEDVQHACHAHLEEHSLAAAAKLQGRTQQQNTRSVHV
jgi:hypothetical protein